MKYLRTKQMLFFGGIERNSGVKLLKIKTKIIGIFLIILGRILDTLSVDGIYRSI
jgi:hypothetical protein